MFNRLLRLYIAGQLTLAGLQNAIEKQWISADQYKEITGEDLPVT